MSDYPKKLTVTEGYARIDWPGHGFYRGTRAAWEFWTNQSSKAQRARWQDVHGLDETDEFMDLHPAERCAVLAEWESF